MSRGPRSQILAVIYVSHFDLNDHSICILWILTLNFFTVLRHLINLGADVNVKDPDGRGPVMWAASAGLYEETMKL